VLCIQSYLSGAEKYWTDKNNLENAFICFVFRFLSFYGTFEMLVINLDREEFYTVHFCDVQNRINSSFSLQYSGVRPRWEPTFALSLASNARRL
jgi:hypothetical protein